MGQPTAMDPVVRGRSIADLVRAGSIRATARGTEPDFAQLSADVSELYHQHEETSVADERTSKAEDSVGTKHMPSTASPARSAASDIENLPPELRKRIYGYVLIPDGLVKLTLHNKTTKWATRAVYQWRMARAAGDLRPPPCFFIAATVDEGGRTPEYNYGSLHRTALLYVSRGVYAEAVRVLYGGNRFHFRDAQVFAEFVRCTGYKITHLQHLIIWDLPLNIANHNSLALEPLRMATQLQTLKIVITHPATTPRRNTVESFWDAIRPFVEGPLSSPCSCNGLDCRGAPNCDQKARLNRVEFASTQFGLNKQFDLGLVVQGPPLKQLTPGSTEHEELKARILKVWQKEKFKL